MTTDITELAQSLKAAAEKYKSVWGIARYSKAVEAREKFHELVTPSNVIALVEALEKAQAIAGEYAELMSYMDSAGDYFEFQAMKIREANGE
ncbi:TPA: hypothetical protein ACPUMQ_003180 [Klebsiella pneumoniae]